MRRVVTAIVAAALVGCAGGTPDDVAPTTPEPGATTTDLGAPEALAFSAALVGGGELDARTLAGRPVVFWFWSPY